MIARVLKLGLEGLVLKDAMSKYEPGKRHWLKVKKDYLFGGAMADSADLIVLGAWYGTGQKGGMMSVFLMGCYDPQSKKFCTVTKVHTGHDDKTLEKLRKQLKMVKISGDPEKVPSWLKCTRTMVPDFVAEDPKKQPIWEVTGAEFSQQHDVHTAGGISIRFPRVTKIRDDKTWETATNVDELKLLFKNSKEDTDVSLLLKNYKGDQGNSSKDTSSTKSSDSNRSTPKKRRLVDDADSSTSSRDSSGVNDSSKKRKKDDSPKRKEKEDSSKKRERESSSNKRERDDSSKKREKDDSSIEKEKDDSPKKKYKRERSKERTDSSASSKRRSKKGEPSSSTHTESDNENGEVETVKIKNPLPDFFDDIKVLFATSEDEEIERYFVAFGGTILKQHQSEEATHIVHFNKEVKDIPTKWPKQVRHVHVSWVVDCANEKKLLSEESYVVKWKPENTEEDKKCFEKMDVDSHRDSE